MGSRPMEAHTPPLIVPVPSAEAPENELAAIVYRLVSEVQEVQQALTDCFLIEDHEVFTSASIGIAMGHPG